MSHKENNAQAPNFGQLFIQSKGEPIEHAGKQLVMVERFPAKPGQRFQVTIESTQSTHPQGVGISEDVEVFGSLRKRVVVWEHMSLPPKERGKKPSALPFSFVVTYRGKRGYVSFYNVTQCNGKQTWWHGGSCMTTISIPQGRRCFCNDFELDDDFDDLIFSVVEEPTPVIEDPKEP